MIAVVSALAVKMIQHSQGGMIQITIDGQLYGEYSLSEDQVITIEEPFGYNQIIVREGAAYMSKADCPDQYCMEYVPISKQTELIVCLPHKLVVEVTQGTAKEKTDVIVP